MSLEALCAISILRRQHAKLQWRNSAEFEEWCERWSPPIAELLRRVEREPDSYALNSHPRGGWWADKECRQLVPSEYQSLQTIFAKVRSLHADASLGDQESWTPHMQEIAAHGPLIAVSCSEIRWAIELDGRMFCKDEHRLIQIHFRPNESETLLYYLQPECI